VLRDDGAAPRGELTAAVDKVVAEQQTFLPAMEEIVHQYDRESVQRRARLRRIELVLFALMMGTLVAAIVFIFRPVVRRVSQLLAERDRTAIELRDKNRELDATLNDGASGDAGKIVVSGGDEP